MHTKIIAGWLAGLLAVHAAAAHKQDAWIPAPSDEHIPLGYTSTVVSSSFGDAIEWMGADADYGDLVWLDVNNDTAQFPPDAKAMQDLMISFRIKR